MDPQKIIDLLNQIGNKVGPYGQHVWELAVRQVFVESLIWGVFCLIAMLVTTIVSIRCIQYGITVDKRIEQERGNSYRSDKDKDDIWLPIIIGVGIFGIGSIFFVVPLIQNAIHLLNPEWAAIEKLGALLPK